MANYKWTYAYVGGVPRVRIATGNDIAHLSELDQKLWTILSCPVKGLEIDEESLKYMDTNNDGSIHVTEVVSIANWLKDVLKDMDILLKGKDSLPLSALNAESEAGKQLAEAAQQILTHLNKADATEISLADSSSCLASVLARKLEMAQAEAAAIHAMDAPFGEDTAAIDAAYHALDAKIRDYFMRAKLASFAEESITALDVQVSSIEAISADNLTDKTAEIAAYPIARITNKAELPLDASINPVWNEYFQTIKKAFADTKVITPTAWDEIGDKLKTYADYQTSIEVNEADIQLDEEAANIQLVDKLLHLTRDYFVLLKNFVTLHDFYSRDNKGIFQAGTLYIDQRACDMCVKVADPGTMAALAGSSGLFLAFCDCVSKVKGETMKIAAAITVGDTNNIVVGKNGIFYDRQGHDWDAKVTSVIDNPISISQAFWWPYKKVGKFVEEKISKMASEKESNVLNDATTKIDAQTAEAPAEEGAPTPTAQEKAKAMASSFDIAKFCGIFAAIGIALGAIGTFLLTIGRGFLSLTWWQMPLSIIAIMLLISGPSMFIAWMKLRKRNLAPLLNANGWAVNATARINDKFGCTLTQQAKFPISASLKRNDPFADKDVSIWTKLLIMVVLAVLVVGGLWLIGVFTLPGLQSPLL
ncbi:MAG: hypothetical protein HUJ98_01385 [Bacteroidaceae bacterium]|nr:hypothetical protein [Bacteroidaceae bacterium]